MVEADVNNVKNAGVMSGLGTSLGMSAVLTGGFGSLSSIKRNKGITKALKQTHLNNEIINEFLKNNSNNVDNFTKAYAAARNYEKYNGLLKTANKAQKTYAKMLKKGKPSFLQKLFNLGKEPADIMAKYKSASETAAEELSKAANKLKNGQEIIDTAKKGSKTAEKSIMQAGLKANTKSLFKEELFNPMNILYAVTSTAARIKDEAVPAFKEKGVKEGIKQTLVCIGKSAADIVSNAGFSAVFRTIGYRVGFIFGNAAGAAVGGTIGDILGTFLSNKVITKVLGEDKPKNENKNNSENSVSNDTYIQNENQPTNIMPKDVIAEEQTSTNANKTNEHPLGHLEGKELMDYADKVRVQANSYKIKHYA